MYRLPLFCFLLALAGQLSSCQQSIALFEEDDSNWLQEGASEWRFSQGILEGLAKGAEGFVMTKDTYDDFLLELEFYPDSTVNSGVFVRCQGIALSATECHEMNIWDLHPNQDFRTGAIVTKTVPENTVNTINRWNSYKIRCEDAQVQVWVNDTLTAQFEDRILDKGHVGLQASGTGSIQFRNIRLKEL